MTHKFYNKFFLLLVQKKAKNFRAEASYFLLQIPFKNDI
jgi:hypothetical protein